MKIGNKVQKTARGLQKSLEHNIQNTINHFLDKHLSAIEKLIFDEIYGCCYTQDINIRLGIQPEDYSYFNHYKYPMQIPNAFAKYFRKHKLYVKGEILWIDNHDPLKEYDDTGYYCSFSLAWKR